MRVRACRAPLALGARACLALLVVAVALFGVPLGLPVQGAPRDVEITGRILAVVGRQVGWLNLDAPRPTVLTAFPAPTFALDVAAPARSTTAVVAVFAPYGGGNSADTAELLNLDLRAGTTSPLLGRSDAGESLTSPAWLPDGSVLLYQRQRLFIPPGGLEYEDPLASRVELIRSDGSGRTAVVFDAYQPAPAPDGARVAFLRLFSQGTALVERTLDPSGAERTIVPASRFQDISYPRYAPSGDQLVFFVTATVGRGVLLADLLLGTPWDLWLVQADGSGLRKLASLGADDPTATWSPDGSQLFIYSGSGAWLLDPRTETLDRIAYISGYGLTAWLAD
jgi:Tol biopolymer transport system component